MMKNREMKSGRKIGKGISLNVIGSDKSFINSAKIVIPVEALPPPPLQGNNFIALHQKSKGHDPYNPSYWRITSGNGLPEQRLQNALHLLPKKSWHNRHLVQS